jgi:hypothetical protein
VRIEDSLEVIYLMNADMEELTPVGIRAIHPQWSPNGAAIACCTDDDLNPPKKNPAAIYLIGVRDRRLTRLISGGVNTYPAWSPDGKRLVANTEGWLPRRNGRETARRSTSRSAGRSTSGGIATFSWRRSSDPGAEWGPPVNVCCCAIESLDDHLYRIRRRCPQYHHPGPPRRQPLDLRPSIGRGQAGHGWVPHDEREPRRAERTCVYDQGPEAGTFAGGKRDPVERSEDLVPGRYPRGVRRRDGFRATRRQGEQQRRGPDQDERW